MAHARRARLRGAGAVLALSVGGSLTCVAAPTSADAPKAGASAAATAAPQAATAVTVAAPPAVTPKEKRERQARALEFHNEAKALYERGLYRRAIAKLEAAIALDPEGKELVYNLALIHEKLAEADIAEGYYLRYVEMENDPKARERVLAIVKRLQGAKKNLKADLQERAAASASAAASAFLAPSASASASAARTPSPMVFVISGVAIAAAGVGVGFGVSALATHPGEATTTRSLTAYDLEIRARSAHTQAVVADLAFMTSIVVGGAAVVLYLLETRSRTAPAAGGSAPAAPVATSAARVRLEAPF